MNNILITGGQGFIGGRLAEFLSKNINNKVVVTSRNPIHSNNSKIKSISVNTKTDSLSVILKDYTTVIHLAALDAQNCVSQPFEAVDVNIGDTLRWRIAADIARVQQFIYFSTIHVYGNTRTDLIHEESCAYPSHPYAISHKSAEDYVLSPLYRKNSNSIVFRLSNAYGYPSSLISQWHLVILDFCKQALETNRILINSNSSQFRDFISLTDVCRSVQFSIENNIDSGIYNLCSGENRTLLEVATLIKQIAFEKYNQSITIIEKVDRSFVNQGSISIKKLNQLGFELANEMESEISELLEYCKQSLENSW